MRPDPAGSGSLVDLTEASILKKSIFDLLTFYKEDSRNSKSSLAEWTLFGEPSFYVQDSPAYYLS
jgi:hypothetical protein